MPITTGCQPSLLVLSLLVRDCVSSPHTCSHTRHLTHPSTCHLNPNPGAEHDCYTADITRTFPASGTFTAQQRDIYNLVLHMQQHALDTLKPGLPWADVQRSTRLLMLDGLQQLGLVVQGDQAFTEGLMEAGVDKLFMPHGLGHFLGLDVHDVSDVGPVPQQLAEGHVVTVEPGATYVVL